MAKKTKSETTGALVAIILIIAVIAILACVASLPLILLVGAIVYHYKFTCVKRGLRNHLSDFWLNEEEKKEFKTMRIKREEYATTIVSAEREAEKAGICKNKDGHYSTRSNLGKKIKQIYDSYIPIIKEIDERLNELRDQPINRWGAFSSMACNSRAFRSSLIVWLGIMAYNLSSAYKQGAFELQIKEIGLYFVGTFEYVCFKVFLMGAETTEPVVCPIGGLQASLYPFAGAIVALLIFKGVWAKSGKKFSPEPPKVTIENIDSIE